MATIPAICDTCGAIFPSSFGGTATFIDCKSGPCPACGGLGSVPDGTYQTVGQVIRLLAGPQKTLQQLQAISQAVAHARSNSSNSVEAIQKLRASAPELGSIADTLPTTRNELYAFLTLILTALGVLIATATLWKGQGPSEADIQRMIEETLKNATKSEKAASDAAKPKRAARKDRSQ